MYGGYQVEPNVFHIGKKGVYVLDDEVVSVGSDYDRHWGRKLPPWERLNQHHTINSAAHDYRLRGKKRTGDALDFVLSSVYDHSTQLFPEDEEIYRQKENVEGSTRDAIFFSGADNLRVAKYSKETKYSREEKDCRKQKKVEEKVICVNPSYEVVIGGIKERRSPHSVRLNLSSHHMSRTAGGYGRKVDGSFYAP
ncbi:uncharacterized protein C1orf194 homolog [Ischnura elegans]|uniref:uncharacterized protein C1orf194 homolog n=1 Tax=Ischnura elegans TaxID=197161 RepID=UPI001ED8A164|nr:uncharacterized protein C1orf194 homolog [Ischnura elegans]